MEGQVDARDGQSPATHRVLRGTKKRRHEESPSWLWLGLIGLVAVAFGYMLLVVERADRSAILLVISWLGWLVEGQAQRLSR